MSIALKSNEILKCNSDINSLVIGFLILTSIFISGRIFCQIYQPCELANVYHLGFIIHLIENHSMYIIDSLHFHTGHHPTSIRFDIVIFLCFDDTQPYSDSTVTSMIACGLCFVSSSSCILTCFFFFERSIQSCGCWSEIVFPVFVTKSGFGCVLLEISMHFSGKILVVRYLNKYITVQLS